MRTLFKLKAIDDVIAASGEKGQQLKRVLGPVQITLLGIGAIIGAGIFATIGTAAAGDAQRLGAGPALVISFIVAAVVCSFAAFCYAELASMVPISGSAYTYAYATLGEFIAWIIGWDLIIEYAIGNVAVAISWSNYFKTFLAEGGINIPDWLSTDFTTAQKIPGLLESAPHLFGVPFVVNVPAFLIIAGITAVLMVGIRESARFNAGMVIVKLLVLAFFVFIGAKHMSSDNLHPFMPNGFKGVFSGAAVIFFAFIGFDAVSTVAEETKNPKRDLPIGILASLAICTVIYILVAIVFTGMISYSDLKQMLADKQAEPLALALKHANVSGFAIYVVAAGSVVAQTAVLLVFQMGQPRIFFAMARDGLLPPMFAKVHPKFGTPWVSTLLTGAVVGLLAMVSSLDEMVDLTNIGTLFAFIIVCAGVIILRVKEPNRPRSFRVPGGYLPPILGILGCLGLIIHLPPTSWLRFAAWLNIGILVFVTYGSRESRLTGRAATPDLATLNARTAYEGAWLGILGLLLMFIATTADALSMENRPAEWWFPKSAWLWVPLLMNALILCPAVILRARSAMTRGASGRLREFAAKGMWLGATQLVLITGYLVAGWVFRG